MTNTLHRYGTSENLQNDIIVFAIPCRGFNDRDAVPKLREFLRMAAKYRPVNMGDGSKGSIYRPQKRLNPLAHWFRKTDRRYEAVINGVTNPTTVAAVFDDRATAEKFVEEVRSADLGISINISATIDRARQCCQDAGLSRHSVEYSLGFMGGGSDRLADRRTLELSTMCGHGMISFNFARKMIDFVKEGRRTPEQACGYMARLCSCGVFNPSRARQLLDECRLGKM